MGESHTNVLDHESVLYLGAERSRRGRRAGTPRAAQSAPPGISDSLDQLAIIRRLEEENRDLRSQAVTLALHIQELLDVR